MKENRIHTVGDSHAWHAWLKIPFVTYHTIGPMTMYRFGQSRPYILSGIPGNSIVVFCWGEIDCRCHINKHLPFEQTIDKLVFNYFEAIKENISFAHDDGKTIHPWIFNVVPPPRKENTEENPSFPFLGSNEDRLSYVKHINETLKKTGYPIVNIYDEYADEEGFLRKDMSDGHVHIADEVPLTKKIVEMLLERSFFNDTKSIHS